jgi:hypothetical protein
LHRFEILSRIMRLVAVEAQQCRARQRRIVVSQSRR